MEFFIEMTEETLNITELVCNHLEILRAKFNTTKDKKYWYSMIQLLSSSYNQMIPCTMTYENIRNMYHARNNHKIKEWHKLCDWVNQLP